MLLLYISNSHVADIGASAESKNLKLSGTKQVESHVKVEKIKLNHSKLMEAETRTKSETNITENLAVR